MEEGEFTGENAGEFSNNDDNMSIEECIWETAKGLRW